MTILEYSNHHLAEISLSAKLLQSNIITISSEITYDTASEYQQQLLYLKNKATPGEMITIVINSPGGNVLDGLGLYDIIQSIKNSGIIVKTKVIGHACSMAAILLMSGTIGYRESTPNSTIMIHEISGFEYGKFHEMLDGVEEFKREQEIINKIITDNSCSDLIHLCERKDLWLSPDDAIKYNIIDKITL